MNLALAFFKLIRWTNLVFIVLTQVLFYYCILPFVHKGFTGNEVSPAVFYMLVSASVCIAAAGYIINDYFDLNIDLVNKPSKLIIEKYINRRWAMVFHLGLSFTGFAISGYA